MTMTRPLSAQPCEGVRVEAMSTATQEVGT